MMTAVGAMMIHTRFCFKIHVASYTIHMVGVTSVASYVLNQDNLVISTIQVLTVESSIRTARNCLYSP
jgi:hypothetical protein